MLFTFTDLFTATNGLFAWSAVVDDEDPAVGLLEEDQGEDEDGDSGSRWRRPRLRSYA